MQITHRNYILSVLMLSLTACGGGTTASIKPRTIPTPEPKRLLYYQDRISNTGPYHMQQTSVGADSAHKIGWTGYGQYLFMVEVGSNNTESTFEYNLEEFGDRLEDGYVATPEGLQKTENAPRESLEKNEVFHAAMVTGLSIGKKYGIAPEARVIPVSVDDYLHYDEIFAKAQEKNASVISNSWSWVVAKDTAVNALRENALPNFYDTFNTALDNINAATTETARRYNDIPISVFAAGNRSSTDASITASYPGLYSKRSTNDTFKAEDFWIAAINIDLSNNWIAGSSNLCGRAKFYCMGAYGKGAKTVDWTIPDGGTSAATPQISAGLALLKHAFPSKLNQWIQKRLLSTSRYMTAANEKILDQSGTEFVIRDKNDNEIGYDTAEKGYTDELGAGIMRLDLATAPISDTKTVNSGANLNIAKTSLERLTRFNAKAMFGDGIKHALSKAKTYVFDSDNAEFSRTLGDYVSSTSINRLDTYMQYEPAQKSNNNEAGISYAYYAPTVGNKAFKNNIRTLPFADNHDTAITTTHMNMSFSQDSKKRSIETKMQTLGTIQYNVGLLNENGFMMGSSTSGFFGDDIESNTAYTILSTSIVGSNDWNGQISAVLSMSDVKGLNDNLRIMSDIYTSSFNLQMSKKDNNVTYGFALSQPLRVERALMEVTYVDTIDSNNDLTYKTNAFNAAPTGREINLEFFYTLDDKNITWRTYLANDAGHISGEKDYGVILQYKKEF